MKGGEEPLFPGCVLGIGIYLQRTNSFRKLPGLAEWMKGQVISSQRFSKWISSCILLYQSADSSPPQGVRAHSTRVKAASLASLHEVPLIDICKATV